MTRHHNGVYPEDDTSGKVAAERDFRNKVQQVTEDKVKGTDYTRPAHYGGEENPFEPIKIIEHYSLGFSIGNLIKYVLRAGRKDGESYLKDLQKARWYLDQEIQAQEKKNAPG